MLRTKNEIVMERERVRLKRSTNAVFPFKPYELYWSNIETSYYDGKDLYIKYDLSTFFTNEPCSDKDNRIFRITHTFHERGHMEFDDLNVYSAFISENSSVDKKDWEDNVKYPKDFVRHMANILVDGRMEHHTSLAYPFTEPYFRFSRKAWLDNLLAYIDNVQQFTALFMLRSTNLEDRELFRPEVFALVDEIQPLIEKAREVYTTAECLEQLQLILPIVWPTIYEWMKANQKEDDETLFDQADTHDNATWGDADSIAEAIEQLIDKLSKLVEGEEDTPASLDKLEAQIEKEMKADEQAAEDELAPYQEELVTVNIDNKLTSYADQVEVKPFPCNDISCYNTTVQNMKPYTLGVTKALKHLLQATDDELLTRQRSGKLKPQHMWKGQLLNEHTYFSKKIDGSPSTGVRIGIMTDVSGSTGWIFKNSKRTVIMEIKNCLVMLAESTHKLQIPTTIYAFTSYKTVDIFPIKPFGRLSNVEKGFIGGLKPMDANRDTLALQYLVDQMKNYDEEVKVVFMISDGQPCFEGSETPDTIRNIVQQAEKRGIHVVCLYCGPEDEEIINLVRYMYPGGAINVSQNIGRDLSTRLKKIIVKHNQ